MAVALDFENIADTTLVKYAIHNTKQSEKWVYSSVTAASLDVGAPAAIGVKIPARGISGHISEIYFDSLSSTDCDIWICESAPLADGSGVLSTANETIILMEGINAGYSPELSVPRKYHNRDSAPIAYLYLVISNVTVAITTWNLAITFDKE